MVVAEAIITMVGINRITSNRNIITARRTVGIRARRGPCVEDVDAETAVHVPLLGEGHSYPKRIHTRMKSPACKRHSLLKFLSEML
jgi:hypothetical protein